MRKAKSKETGVKFSPVDLRENFPFSFDSKRIPQLPLETKIGEHAFAAITVFYNGMSVTRERYSAEKDKHNLLIAVSGIMANVLDSHLTNRPLCIVASVHKKALEETYQLGWNGFKSAIHALGGLGYINVTVLNNDPDQLKITPGNQFTDEFSNVKAESLNFSRVLDVHRYSEHPEIKAFVDWIYNDHFGTGNVEIQKKHIRTVILDLYVAWNESRALKTAYSRNPNAYKAKSRYNEIHISKKTIDVVDKLEKVGFVFQAIGIPGQDFKNGRQTRMWPTRKLTAHFVELSSHSIVISTHPNRECIILRDDDSKNEGRNIDIEYRDTANTKHMRECLQLYNEESRRYNVVML